MSCRIRINQNEENGYIIPVNNTELLAQYANLLIDNKSLRDKIAANNRKKNSIIYIRKYGKNTYWLFAQPKRLIALIEILIIIYIIVNIYMIYYYYRKPMGIFSPVYVIAFMSLGQILPQLTTIYYLPCVQSLYLYNLLITMISCNLAFMIGYERKVTLKSNKILDIKRVHG